MAAFPHDPPAQMPGEDGVTGNTVVVSAQILAVTGFSAIKRARAPDMNCERWKDTAALAVV